jgi:isopenicillin-N epimerase
MGDQRMAELDRRGFLIGGSALAATALAGCGANSDTTRPQTTPPARSAIVGQTSERDDPWVRVRREFDLSQDNIHMSALLLASHPRPVRAAIERYRHELDRNPVVFLEENNRRRRVAVQQAAGDYLEVDGRDIILTDSTTMGLGLVYNGLRLAAGDEIITTEGDYYVTHESVRLAAARSGATVRQIALAADITHASVDELVSNIVGAIGPRTRVLALTWVHSGSGLKLPLAEIAEAVAASDRGRANHERVLLCIDGVHGFGVENISLRGSRVDFFIAGCHKWLFGPRGTGIVWGNGESWHATRATIPSFIDDGTWSAWINETEPAGPTTATRMMPGGFKPFEHQWAMVEAFEFHQSIGKQRVAARTHELAGQLKQGLARIEGVTVVTPMPAETSSGIVCFDVRGLTADSVVERLRGRNVIASVTPYATRYARLTPSIRNSAAEVERVIDEVARLA